MDGHGSDPLLLGAPNIDLDYSIEIDLNVAAAAVYTVTAQHDLFPAHELYINGQSLHQYDPRVNGATALALMSPPVKFRFTCREGSSLVCSREP